MPQQQRQQKAPRKQPYSWVNVSGSLEFFDEVTEYAKENGLSMSAAIRQLLKYGLHVAKSRKVSISK